MVKCFSLISLLLFASSSSIFGQTKCFSLDESKRIIASIESKTEAVENKPLRNELLNLYKKQFNLKEKILKNPEKHKSLIANSNALANRNLFRLCEILKTNGWLRKDNIGEDALNAFVYIYRSNDLLEIKKEFIPFFAAATKKGFIRNDLFASIIDNIRISAGLPQIFGTQTFLSDEVFYIYPLLNQDRVDAWRKLYDLPTISRFIKNIEINFRMPAFFTDKLPKPPALVDKSKPDSLDLGFANESNDAIKVDTNLVNLNVRILKNDLTVPTISDLKRDDFSVFEDGEKQEIEFFSTTDKPFDLVLLLDLSGSMREKVGVLKESTKRFIDAARPSDRIAIVTFGDYTQIESGLTSDRVSLRQAIGKIGYRGGSRVWDALEFTYQKIIKADSQGRRSAIVFMTDGVDTSLAVPPIESDLYGGIRPRNTGSEITFTNLIETVKVNETTVYPIYLDTETLNEDWVKQGYRTARKTLGIIAEESGGQQYFARNTKDLSGIYERIINDLSKVYSIGYVPKNEDRDGNWRQLTVKLNNRSDLIPRTRRGYYSKQNVK